MKEFHSRCNAKWINEIASNTSKCMIAISILCGDEVLNCEYRIKCTYKIQNHVIQPILSTNLWIFLYLEFNDHWPTFDPKKKRKKKRTFIHLMLSWCQRKTDFIIIGKRICENQLVFLFRFLSASDRMKHKAQKLQLSTISFNWSETVANRIWNWFIVRLTLHCPQNTYEIR